MARFRIIFLGVNTFFVLLLLSLFNLEVVHGRNYRQLGDKNCIRILGQRGSRGKIFDRNRNLIAGNRISYDLLISSQESISRDKAFADISRLLGKSKEELYNAYRKNYFSPSLPVIIAKNLKLKEAIALDELKIEFPFLTVQANPVRHYADPELACHILGYLGQIDHWRLAKLEPYGYKPRDIVGFGGVEEKYDYYLREGEGGMSFQVDHRGRFMRTLGFKPPANGKDIELTIDLRVQKIAQDALGARKGSVIIMDPRNGEIIALASSPVFNLDYFVNENNQAIARVFKDPRAPLINRAISGLYPAGSVFKMVVAAAALEHRKINPATSFLCQGRVMVGRQEFKCWGFHGRQDLFAALTHSCNVYFYRIGLLVGAQAIHDYAVKFGFSRPTQCELPYEKSGFIPSPLIRKMSSLKNWFDGDTANLSIGQGDVQVSPLQVTRMMAAFANGGYLVAPVVTRSIDAKRIVRRTRPERINLKANTLNEIKKGLRGVINEPEGTGAVLARTKVPVAGKTGTAQAPPGQSHSWFSGFFPYKEPRFVITVFLENGGPGYNSCVIAKEILDEMAKQGVI